METRHCPMPYQTALQRTSAKFTQWTDPRTSTVYGLGFPTPDDLDQVVYLPSTYHVSVC